MDQHLQITNIVTDFARQRGVRPLVALESGSRSWGFASQDSDYDVRFIYVLPLDSYLTIGDEKRTEQYEIMLRGALDGLDLDIVGWDIRKFLMLLKKTNPSVIEWVRSPTIYFDTENAYGYYADRFLGLMREHYNPVSAVQHYYSMALNNARQFLQGDAVNRKKYLYVSRPIICAHWILQNSYHEMPPIDINDLLLQVPLEREVLVEFMQLLAEKRAGTEMLVGPRLHALHAFIDESLATLPEQMATFTHHWIHQPLTAPTYPRTRDLDYEFSNIVRANDYKL